MGTKLGQDHGTKHKIKAWEKKKKKKNDITLVQ
jgi:hypothetical protein